MLTADIKNKKYSVIFAIYECERCSSTVFEYPDQSVIKQAFKPLGLPLDDIYIFPPFPFPSFNYNTIFDEAVDKTDLVSNEQLFFKKLTSNLLLSSIKKETTTVCSPIIFLGGQYQSDSFLFRVGEKRQARFISDGQLSDISEVMDLDNLTDLYFLKDIEQERHLKVT